MLSEIVKLELSGNPQLCSLVRKFIGHVCEKTGFSEDATAGIVLAVDEAFSNIIRHTYRMDFQQRITIVASFHEESHLEIRLIDEGPPINPADIRGRPIEELRPGGLGVHFMRSIMDSVEYLPHTKGNVLRMVKYVEPGICTSNKNS